MNQNKDDKDNNYNISANDQEHDLDEDLDDEFDMNVLENLKNNEVKKTLDSFENPVSLEDADNISDSPNINPKQLQELLSRMKNMPRDKLMQLLSNISADNAGNLGGNDFSSVSNKTKLSAHDRLSMKLQNKKDQRTNKQVYEKRIKEHNAKETVIDSTENMNALLDPENKGNVQPKQNDQKENLIDTVKLSENKKKKKNKKKKSKA